MERQRERETGRESANRRGSEEKREKENILFCKGRNFTNRIKDIIIFPFFFSSTIYKTIPTLNPNTSSAYTPFRMQVNSKVQ